MDLDLYLTTLKNYIKPKYDKPLSPKTIETYVRNMKFLEKNIPEDKSIFNLLDLVEFLEKDKNYVNDTKMNYVNVVINYLSLMLPEMDLSQFKEYRQQLIDLKIGQGINPKKKDNLVDWSEIIKWRDLVIAKNRIIYEGKGEVPMDKLQVEALLRIYTDKQRRNEIADLIYGDDVGHPVPIHADNVIFHNTTTGSLSIMLSEYKTKEKYKKQYFEILGDNKEFLLAYIKQNNFDPIMWRCPKSKEPLSRLNLTKLLNRSSQEIIDKTISTTMIRKSYNTTKYKHIKDMLLNDSINNGHSVNTIMENYVV